LVALIQLDYQIYIMCSIFCQRNEC